MTKKDYVLIAKALSNAEPTEAEQELGTWQDGWVRSVWKVAEALAFEDKGKKFSVNKFVDIALKN